MQGAPPAVLVSLCGLPASGKSTFCRNVVKEVEDARHICFDGYLQDDTVFDPSKWKKARQKALEGALSHAEERGAIILLDDNMQYRSMRREVWAMARDIQAPCGFVVAYFPIEAGEAIERDAQRRCPVTPKVIHQMAAALEAPNPQRCPWEKHLYTHCTESSMEGFLEVVERARRLPVQRAPEGCSQQEREADRALTGANLVHTIDIALRKEVASLMKWEGRAGMDKKRSKETHQQLGKACSVIRKQVLTEAQLLKKRGDAPDSGGEYKAANTEEKGAGALTHQDLTEQEGKPKCSSGSEVTKCQQSHCAAWVLPLLLPEESDLKLEGGEAVPAARKRFRESLEELLGEALCELLGMGESRG
ncbi:unnamed protein product [Chrysoparadoxa australica]